MKKYLLFAFFVALTVEYTKASEVTENEVDRDEPGQEAAREPVGGQGPVGRHPYLSGDLYADIASLDLTAKPYKNKRGARRSEKEWPSISVIETNKSKTCVF